MNTTCTHMSIYIYIHIVVSECFNYYGFLLVNPVRRATVNAMDSRAMVRMDIGFDIGPIVGSTKPLI